MNHSLFSEDRYQTKVVNASSMKYPPRIVIGRVPITLDFEAVGIGEIGVVYEYHLYDDRMEYNYCSFGDRYHQSVILGYSFTGSCEITDPAKWEAYLLNNPMTDFREDGEDKPWRLVEDELRGCVGDSDEISVNNDRTVLVVWDFQDSSSDIPEFYDGEYQWDLRKQAIENEETLSESLSGLLETMLDDIFANGDITEFDNIKEGVWE